MNRLSKKELISMINEKVIRNEIELGDGEHVQFIKRNPTDEDFGAIKQQGTNVVLYAKFDMNHPMRHKLISSLNGISKGVLIDYLYELDNKENYKYFLKSNED